MYICFVDFKSALDCVNRSALLYKLLEHGVQGNFFWIVKSMFSKAKCRVKWNNSDVDMFSNLCGVLQGGVISPTLFNIFLEDMFKYFSHDNGINNGSLIFNYLLFADDLVLFSKSKSGLQKHVNGLEKFCRQWQMTVNLLKTKEILPG